MGSDFGHFRIVTFDTIFVRGIARPGAMLIAYASAIALLILSRQVQEVDFKVCCLGTGDSLPSQKHIMKYPARMKLLCAVGLTTLAILTSSGVGANEERARVADQQLKENVENALSSDPYFYGAHVVASVENGRVVLRGFVTSDWDLRDAIRIATRAAGGRRVVDDLTIELGGRR